MSAVRPDPVSAAIADLRLMEQEEQERRRKSILRVPVQPCGVRHDPLRPCDWCDSARDYDAGVEMDQPFDDWRDGR